MIKEKYEPVFELSEFTLPAIGDVKIGQQVKVMVNYMVIEKTKSFTILKVNSAFINDNARKF